MTTSLERLQASVAAELRTVEVRGVPLALSRLTAVDAIALMRVYESLPKDAEGNPTSDDATLDFYLRLVGKSIIEPDTQERLYDSDEGRNVLTALGTDLFVIGQVATELNGLNKEAAEETKKK